MIEGNEKILIIRLSSLGDVILTTPIIRSLKEKFPELKIDFLVARNYSDVFKTNPYLNKIITYHKEKNQDIVSDELQRAGYNLVIDLQNNYRSRRISSKIKAQTRRFKKPNVKKFLLVQFKWNLFKNSKPIPERYASVIPEIKLDDLPPQIFFPENIIPSVKSNPNFIGFAPGSNHYTKMWLEGYYIELGRMLNEKGYTVLLLGGSDDAEICKTIHNTLTDSIDLSTQNDLIQVVRDMKECKLIVCNDSGLMHAASAVNVPVITIFGSTVKEFGFFPYKIKNVVLENKSLSCRPCSHIGRSNCPKEHFKCMKDITPDSVFNEIKRFIGTL